MKKIILLSLLLLTMSCTEQSRVRQFGGDVQIDLPKGEKLLNATWKETNLFYLTEPTESTYQPKIKTFKESSSFGVMETTVRFIEH